MSKLRKKASFKAVVQLPLTPDLVDAIVTLGKPDIEAMWEAAEGLLQVGIKVSFTYDPERGLYSASAFDTDTDSANAGLMLFANGSTIDLALTALVYKIKYVAGNSPWATVSQAISGMLVS